MSDKYILDGKTPIVCNDLMAWARWYETAERQVAETTIGDMRVSTVFLGLDHSFAGFGPPLLFETMIFGGPSDQYQERYSTWEDAENGHAKAVELANGKKLAEAV